MTRILVVYGTTDGHTAKIAGVIAHTLRAHGAAVDVHQSGGKDCRPDGYDGVIVAAPVRGGRYQKSVRRWVRAHAGALNGTTTAFVSVCLGVLQRDPAVDRTLEDDHERVSRRDGMEAVDHEGRGRRPALHPLQLVHPPGDEADRGEGGRRH